MNGALGAINPKNWQYTCSGLLVTIRQGGRVVTVVLPLETAFAEIEKAFREGGIPLPLTVGSTLTVGGWWSKAKKSVKQAVPKKVQKIARKARQRVEKRVRRVVQSKQFRQGVKTLRKGMKAYGDPRVTAALTAASAVPGLGLVTGPAAAASLASGQAARYWDQGEQAYETAKRFSKGKLSPSDIAHARRLAQRASAR